ncbi:unnamed protein product [Rhodiola kirilowii]
MLLGITLTNNPLIILRIRRRLLKLYDPSWLRNLRLRRKVKLNHLAGLTSTPSSEIPIGKKHDEMASDNGMKKHDEMPSDEGNEILNKKDEVETCGAELVLPDVDLEQGRSYGDESKSNRMVQFWQFL